MLALGRDPAVSLGLAHRGMVLGVLGLVAVLVWVSTALVGPVAFLGLIMAGLAHGLMRSARHAALLNAVASHAVEFDDIHRDSGLHPGSPTISAALAVAQAQGVVLDALLRAFALVVAALVIALIGFTAMSGAIGSGGLGDLAYRDGYQRSHADVALVTVVILLLLVQALQMLGDRLVAHYSRR